ncbi:DivIVA domain-containing protein [Arthrobacter crystallopoietes]|uniref:DivIVA domain-containing protein n=1 Tax=Crystallibacter crystallopoietes TaxID=37928 RepID=UPI001ABE7655|nr:DivIVA domain-containing protein [Arthrobacter crystallopoietes]QTG79919.1 DivIVA domain-containing protein [Arthrobacter crystallopoietes]
MALTPEDVVNKRFQPTKFREGYDQDEVDDFLDEIVVELRRLNQENDELRKKLGEATSGQSSAGNVPAPVAAAPKVEPAKEEEPQEEVKEEPKREKPAATVPATAAAPVVSAPAPAAPAAGGGHAATAESAAGVLAMAQKLHDEYVNAGVEQRDKIIAEAQMEASTLVNDAQEKSRKTLGSLEQQKAVLERKLEQLRGFERDYRSRLKAYIEGQLRDLEARGSFATPDVKES